MLIHYQYIKVKPNSKYHRKFLTILEEEKRINEQVIPSVKHKKKLRLASFFLSI